MDAASITAIGLGSVAAITSVGAYLSGIRAARVAARSAQIEADSRLAIARVEAESAHDVTLTTGKYNVAIAEAPTLAARLERLEAKHEDCQSKLVAMHHELAALRAQHAEDMINALAEFQAQRREERKADAIMFDAMTADLRSENAALEARIEALERPTLSSMRARRIF